MLVRCREIWEKGGFFSRDSEACLVLFYAITGHYTFFAPKGSPTMGSVWQFGAAGIQGRFFCLSWCNGNCASVFTDLLYA